MAHWNDPRAMADELSATRSALRVLLDSLTTSNDLRVAKAAQQARDLLTPKR